ncbi:histidine kinase dimerization/phosphoacceptor domain-containing protein [Nonomuraea sp. NPDC002799]
MESRRWVAEAGLGAVFAAAVAFQAYRIAESWGGAFWWFGCAAGTVVCGLALVRRRAPFWTAIAGLAVAGAAIVVTRVAGLPAEPGPAMTLGWCVLVGAAIRVLPVRQAATPAAGGFAVVAGGLVAWRLADIASGLATGVNPAVVTLNALGWPAALAAGLGPRLLDARRRAVAERGRRHERRVLARELHDVVAHHITCVVLRAQAAQVVARRHPERTESSPAEIEVAGSEALAATLHVTDLRVTERARR